MKFKYEEQTLHDLTQMHPLTNKNQMPPNKEVVKNIPGSVNFGKIFPHC